MPKTNAPQIASDEIRQLHSYFGPSGFLNLPFDIRRIIYSFLIPRKQVIRITRSMLACGIESSDNDSDFFNSHHSRLNVLHLSREISEEALDILYGENLFQVFLNGDGEGDLEHNFTERNRHRIRNLLVLMTDRGVSSTPNIPLWASLLPNLKVFQIIAEQPMEARAYWNAPTLEQDLNDWVKWAMTYFHCFRQYLGTATRVELDDDNRKEARSLADGYLPLTYQKIRHPRGDLVFRRGQHSIESGY